jgi:hypothetical protein
MRNDIVAYIKTLSLGTFTFSEELPRSETGQPLYIKNPKRIYVDIEQYGEDVLVQALDGLDVHTESTTVSVFFTADAKSLPTNYNTLVSNLKLGKNVNTTDGYNTRTVNVETEFEDDLLITRIDFTFSKIT